MNLNDRRAVGGITAAILVAAAGGFSRLRRLMLARPPFFVDIKSSLYSLLP